MSRISLFCLILPFFCTALLVIVQVRLSLKHTETKPAFFFEHSSPQSLSFRNTGLSAQQIPIATQSLQVLNEVFVEQYIPWHSSVVTDVLSGQLDGSTVRTLVFIGNNAGHGLGDRLRGLLLAYMCAVMSNRLFLIHWPAPFPLTNILLNNVHSNFTYDESLFPSSTRPDGSDDVKRVRRATFADLQFYSGKRGNYTKVLFACEPEPTLDGLNEAILKFPHLPASVQLRKVMPFQVPVTEEQFFPLLFKALFTPSPELRRMIAGTVNQPHRFDLSTLWKEAPVIDVSKPFISVHARLGHGVGENNPRFKRQMQGQSMQTVANCLARKAMKLAVGQGISYPPRFYIACDTSEFRSQLKTALLHVNNHSKIMYGTWHTKHVRDMVDSTRDDFRLLLYTFVDLYVLSKGQAILRGDSGFANLALWMGAIPEQSYYDVHTECEKHYGIPD